MMNDKIKRGMTSFRRYLLLLSHFLIFSFSQSLLAQDPFTVRLQQTVAGKGTVRLHHDAGIEALLFARRSGTAARSLTQRGIVRDSLVTLSDSIPSGVGRKVRMNGYRVQVYAGGNTRDAKNRAYQMEAQVKMNFPDQPVYTRFVSPRWICHVGDFQTREEALELLDEMRRTGRFSEAITVRCKINAYVYE